VAGVKSKLTGVPEVSAAFAAMIAQVEGVTGPTVKKVLDQVGRHERTLLSLGYHPYGTPTGSVPPSPPWRIFGDLSRSVWTEPTKRTVFTWSGRVGPTSPYGRIHELGGWTGRRHATYLPPRPHLDPAWRIVRPSVRFTFEVAWLHATRPPR
jgi:hypothetical protein